MADDDAKHWIYAGGLPYELTEGDVICVFSQYGEILQFTLSRDKVTGKSRGFGFLKYEDARSCELAVDNFNGATIVGRRIKVSFANNMGAIKTVKPVNVAPDADAPLPIDRGTKRYHNEDSRSHDHRHHSKEKDNHPREDRESRRSSSSSLERNHKPHRHHRHKRSRHDSNDDHHRRSDSSRRHEHSRRSHRSHHSSHRSHHSSKKTRHSSEKDEKKIKS